MPEESSQMWIYVQAVFLRETFEERMDNMMANLEYEREIMIADLEYENGLSLHRGVEWEEL